MCNHKKKACSDRLGYFETFNAFNRILIGGAGTNIIVRPMAKAFVFSSEPEDNSSALMMDTIYGLESTPPERSRVSGIEIRILTDTRI